MGAFLFDAASRQVRLTIMTNLKDETTSRSYESPLRKLLHNAKILLIVALVASILILLFEVSGTNSVIRYDLTKIGSWGDAVGGFLNPIFGFAALIGLLHTIELQLRELELTRRQVKKSAEELAGSRLANEALVKAADQQNIENSFFQLFNYFTRSVDNMNFVGSFGTASVKIASGARGFEKVSKEFHLKFGNHLSNLPVTFNYNSDPDTWPPDGIEELMKSYKSETELAKDATLMFYEQLYSEHQAELGKYYRVLYNILRFLDNKRDVLPATMVETYTKMFRACLSNYELFLVFLNCLTDKGKPMIKYVNRFSLFDNLPPELFVVVYKDDHGNPKGELDLRLLAAVFDDSAFGDQVEFFRAK